MITRVFLSTLLISPSLSFGANSKIVKYFFTSIIFVFLVSCNYNQNINKIPKKSGSTLKMTTGGVEAKID